MRIHYSFIAVIALSLAIGGFLASDAARAGPEQEAASGQLVYDVRIVQVVTPMAEGVEAPCPFLQGDATTTSATWPQSLAALKKRGTTRILMDQRLTGFPGRIIKGSEERQIPIVQIQTKTLTSENYAAARIRTGCNVDLMAEGDGSQFYKVMIRGSHLPLTAQATAAVETMNAWEGTHAALEGRTLVLTYRTQRRDHDSQSIQGLEYYCLLHGRRAAAK